MATPNDSDVRGKSRGAAKSRPTSTSKSKRSNYLSQNIEKDDEHEARQP